MTNLNVKNVSFSYEQTKILDNISLHVNNGEFVTILGTSGVGKTTLFHLIAGLIDGQEGQIEVDNVPLLKHQVSYMLQKDVLLPHKNVIDNVMLPKIIQGINKREAHQEALALLERFQLDAYATKYPHELSGGMKQRIALLRTYMFGHSLFLLDEAFGALDALTKLEVHQWYKAIHKQFQLTSVLITHDVQEAVDLSDRIYIMQGRPGKITAELVIHINPNEDEAIQRTKYKQEILSILGVKK
ncbi:ABC transporter ATP-binding protein [Carnobacteriaceae bacterium zg-ZUI240]|nr:ABC transporter ATP-binding protein [Carnobacteriaceae bacterium zg-ZUI240]